MSKSRAKAWKAGRGDAASKPAAGGRRHGKAHRGPLWRGRWGPTLAIGIGLVIGLAVLAVQGAHPSFFNGAQGGAAGDFRIIAYQGETVLGGKETKFSKVFEQGKPIVLNFWAGNCPSCSVEMPGFQKVSTEFAGTVIFVGLDVGPFTGLGTHEDAVTLARQLGIRYPLAYAVDASSLRFYKVQGMPTTVFLNAKGQVAAKVTGIMTEGQLRSEIQQKLLAPTS